MSEVKTDKISSVLHNGDITLDPDGTGDTIIASGKVGIGTTSPDNSLHIQNSDFATLKLEHTNTSGTQICDVIGESNGTQKWRLGKLSLGLMISWFRPELQNAYERVKSSDGKIRDLQTQR